MNSLCSYKTEQAPRYLYPFQLLGSEVEKITFPLLSLYVVNKELSRYHIVILSLYTLVCLYLFVNTPDPLSYYHFDVHDLWLFVPISVGTFVSLFVANHFIRFGSIGTNKKSLTEVLLLIIYAGPLIAIPEEILFRGIIQTYLLSFIPSATLAILSSSSIFGLAHLGNGTRGLSPRTWNWKLTIMTFVAGLSFGALFYITDSLVLPTILHALLVIVMKIFITK